MDDNNEEVLNLFIDESSRLIAELNEKLLIIENDGATDALIDEIFRAAHSVKGSAGFFDFTNIVAVTHSLETVLDTIRMGKLEFNDVILDTLFQALDILSSQMADLLSEENSVDTTEIIDNLNALLGKPTSTETESSSQEESDLPLPPFLSDKVSEDDLLEIMIAKNNDSYAYILKVNLQDIFDTHKNFAEIVAEIETIATIQNSYPIPSHHDINTLDLLDPLSVELTLLLLSDNKYLCDTIKTIIPVHAVLWELETTGPLKPPTEIHSTSKNTHNFTSGTPVKELVVKSGMGKQYSIWNSETLEELQQLEEHVLILEQSSKDIEEINKVFRLTHRLKGSSATMGVQEMARIAHNAESLLSYCREVKEVNEEAVKILLTVKDFLFECLNRISNKEKESPSSEELDKALSSFFEAHKISSVEPPPPSLTNEEKQVLTKVSHGDPTWKLSITLENNTPLKDVRYIMILSNFSKEVTIIQSTPTLGELKQGATPQTLSVIFSSTRSPKELSHLIQYDMIKDFSLTEIDSTIGHTKVEKESSTKSKQNKPKQLSTPDTVRVDTEKLDNMMNEAGELVITKAKILRLADLLSQTFQKVDTKELDNLLNQFDSENDNQQQSSIHAKSINLVKSILAANEYTRQLRDTVSELHRHTNSVQSSIMQIRMVPVAPLFQRFQRLIRDLCKQNGKKARLVLVGEHTELDKKVTDELVDPLTHLIRNGIDHGMETVEERGKCNKPESGTITLSAFRDGGQICIRIEDDGRGMDKEKIKAKGIANGLITPDDAEKLSDEDIYHMIFNPGFSTAEKVTNISGRGVGMDIVSSKITELKGKIDINTTLGKGTSFTLRLPMTLAMINTLLVDIAQSCYAFPVENVREIVDVNCSDITSIENKGMIINLRGEVIPVIDLAEIIQIEQACNQSDTLRLVITKNTRESLAIIVDSIRRSEEIVVKSLPEEFSNIRGVSGSTIMGDGSIALILDIGTIGEMASERKPNSIMKRDLYNV